MDRSADYLIFSTQGHCPFEEVRRDEDTDRPRLSGVHNDLCYFHGNFEELEDHLTPFTEASDRAGPSLLPLAFFTSNIVSDCPFVEPRHDVDCQLIDPAYPTRSTETSDRAGPHNLPLLVFSNLSPIGESEHHPNCKLNICYSISHPTPNRELMCVEDPAVAAQLIEKGASVNYQDNKGSTPLHVSRNVEMAEFLLKNDANINCANRYGDTPLHCARTPEMAALLIDQGADVHSRNIHGNTPLHELALNCEASTQHMAVLIEKGANINAVNDKGQTPLNYAVQKRLVGGVATLLYYNADTSVRDRDNHDSTPIMLLYYHANTFIRDKYACSSTMYHSSSFQDAPERLIYEMLIGYEYNFSCSANGDPTALTLALVSKSPYLDEMINLGVDFSNLRHEVRILLWCIHQPDIEEFKWFWDIFDYKKSWNYCNSILEYLLTKRKYSAFDYVLESSKMKVVIEVHDRNKFAKPYLDNYDVNEFSLVTRPSYDMYLKGFDIKISDILDATLTGYNKSKAERAIFILLSYGYVASGDDAYHIFKLYGYGPLFELLLHLGVEANNHTCSNSRGCLSYLLAKILLDPSVDAREYLLSERYGKKEMEAAREIQGVFFTGAGIPTLTELSRNQARVAIWNGYKMKNLSQFYTTVKWMDIPPLIKDILTFKLPIYGGHENELPIHA